MPATPILRAVAGLPGSGKTTLLARWEAGGFAPFDAAGRDWGMSLLLVRRTLTEGRSVAVADVELCRAGRRRWLEAQFGVPVQWHCFANDPAQARHNCIWRWWRHEPDRPLRAECEAIERLSAVYQPEGVILPLWRPD